MLSTDDHRRVGQRVSFTSDIDLRGLRLSTRASDACDLPLLRGNTVSGVSLFGMFARHLKSNIQCSMLTVFIGLLRTPLPHASVSGDDLPLAHEDPFVRFRSAGTLCTGREREEQLVLRCHDTVLQIEVSHNSPPSHLRLTGYRGMHSCLTHAEPWYTTVISFV